MSEINKHLEKIPNMDIIKIIENHLTNLKTNKEKYIEIIRIKNELSNLKNKIDLKYMKECKIKEFYDESYIGGKFLSCASDTSISELNQLVKSLEYINYLDKDHDDESNEFSIQFTLNNEKFNISCDHGFRSWCACEMMVKWNFNTIDSLFAWFSNSYNDELKLQNTKKHDGNYNTSNRMTDIEMGKLIIEKLGLIHVSVGELLDFLIFIGNIKAQFFSETLENSDFYEKNANEFKY